MDNTNKRAFPFFKQNPTSCYLDNAATTHICEPALAQINQYYQRMHATVHRSSHPQAIKNTNQFELIRAQTAAWLNVADKRQIIWCKSATEASNLLAYSLAAQLTPQDEVIISLADHHASFVCWQQLAKQYHFKLHILPLQNDYRIAVSQLKTLLNKNTKVVCLPHVANSTGLKQDIELAQQLVSQTSDAFLLIDGAQAINHLTPDLTALAVDAYYFSGHKMYAGTGLGVLYVSHKLLKNLTPLLYGGEMVREVDNHHSVFSPAPFLFEAGTPNTAAVYAFGAAVKFRQNQLSEHHFQHETRLIKTLLNELNQLDYIQVYGQGPFCGALSFSVRGMHSSDAGELLSQMGISLRYGYLCAMPAVKQLNPQGIIRASVAAYSEQKDIEQLIEAIKTLESFI